MDKNLLIRLARAYVLYAYRTCDLSQSYWLNLLKELNNIEDIIIVEKKEDE